MIITFAAVAALLVAVGVLWYKETHKPIKFKIVSVQRQHIDFPMYEAYCSRYGVLWSRVEQGPENESEHGRGYLESPNIEVVRKEVVRRVTEIRESTAEIRKTVGEWNVHA